MSSVSIGDLVPRTYGNFRGIDATKRDVNLSRSPDSLNMWINYKDTVGKCIETRPGLELLKDIKDVYGIHFYNLNNVKMIIIHAGTKLYRLLNNNLEEIYNGMTPSRSISFVYKMNLYIKDSGNYVVYNGTSVKEVPAYVPVTFISGVPINEDATMYTSKGSVYESVNLLSDYQINSFSSNGESVYKLNVESFDTDEAPEVAVNGIKLTPLVDYSWNATEGYVKLANAPETRTGNEGTDNVYIKFKKVNDGYKDMIKYCTLCTAFNGDVFFSGNPDYPNTLFGTSPIIGIDNLGYNLFYNTTEEAGYVPYSSMVNDGYDNNQIKALIPANNALWVIKEPNDSNTTVFYHTPNVEINELGIERYVYPNTHSSISTGCLATGINFNDDIVFFSNRGMEGITGDITTEQLLSHRSSLIDAMMLNEENYKDMILEEWEGYLLVIIDNKVYLANSRSKLTNDDHIEYDWFYWELEKNITCTKVFDNVLYLGTEDGIYTLTATSEERNINSYWTTPEDEFKAGEYQKTTSKRGCVVNLKGKEITISTKIDNKDFETIDTYKNEKEYVVPRVKKKKWKSIQLKFSSNKPFGLFSCELQAYIGGYIKR